MILYIYTDGSVRKRNPGPCSGSALIYDNNHELLLSAGVFLGSGTNNVGELSGILIGAQLLDFAINDGMIPGDARSARKIFRSDSQYAIRAVEGVQAVRKNSRLVDLCQEAIMRLDYWMLEKIKGHSNNPYNDAADAVAKDAVLLTTPGAFVFDGPLKMWAHSVKTNLDLIL